MQRSFFTQRWSLIPTPGNSLHKHAHPLHNENKRTTSCHLFSDGEKDSDSDIDKKAVVVQKLLSRVRVDQPNRFLASRNRTNHMTRLPWTCRGRITGTISNRSRAGISTVEVEQSTFVLLDQFSCRPRLGHISLSEYLDGFLECRTGCFSRLVLVEQVILYFNYQ